MASGQCGDGALSSKMARFQFGPRLVHRNSKSFQDYPSHQILRHVYEALNIDENKN